VTGVVRLLAAAVTLAGGTAFADTAPVPPPAPLPTPPAANAAREQAVPDQVVALLGLSVRDQDGKEFGRIVDVLVDKAGQPRAVVVDVGGFLGMGNRKVAVEWSALHFMMAKPMAAMVAIPADRIKAAPAYDSGKPVEAVGLPGPAPGAASPAPAATQ
jgi:sporulation protein YlmC with PRC-barrel domain